MCFCLGVYLQDLQASHGDSGCFYGCVDFVLPYPEIDNLKKWENQNKNNLLLMLL